jgi:phosphoglycolate phosphatase
MLVRRGLTAGLGVAPSETVLDAALAAFHRCYRANLFSASRLYPGVPETLLDLRRRGIVLGCITNKPQAYTDPLLEQAGIAGLLDFAFSGDTFDTKKPHAKPLLRAAAEYRIAPADAVMVGDSKNDRDAAGSAGFGFVFAAYGYASPDDPELNQADAVLGAFSSLSELLSG